MNHAAHFALELRLHRDHEALAAHRDQLILRAAAFGQLAKRAAQAVFNRAVLPFQSSPDAASDPAKHHRSDCRPPRSCRAGSAADYQGRVREEAPTGPPWKASVRVRHREEFSSHSRHAATRSVSSSKSPAVPPVPAPSPQSGLYPAGRSGPSGRETRNRCRQRHTSRRISAVRSCCVSIHARSACWAGAFCTQALPSGDRAFPRPHAFAQQLPLQRGAATLVYQNTRDCMQ